MNDCFWAAIGLCSGNCAEGEHPSINSAEGRALEREYDELVEKAIYPIQQAFAKKHGFKEGVPKC